MYKCTYIGSFVFREKHLDNIWYCYSLRSLTMVVFVDMSRYTTLVSEAIFVPIQTAIPNVLFSYQYKVLFGFHEKKNRFYCARGTTRKFNWLIFFNIHVKKSLIHFEQNRVQWCIFRNPGKFHLKKEVCLCIYDCSWICLQLRVE